MSKSGMLAAVAAAAGIAAEQAGSFVLSAQTLAEHFPDVHKAVETAAYDKGLKDGHEQGAEAEHKRLAGIEAASLPGHEAIITAHKADRGKTPADAALAIISAQKAKAAAIKGALVADEEKLAGLKSTGGDTPATAGGKDPQAEAREIAARATEYVAQQAAKGITVSVVNAVAHVTREG